MPYVNDLPMYCRAFSLLLLLSLSLSSCACEGGKPPEDKLPEITLENIRKDLTGKQVRVPSETDSAETSGWRFNANEPKEIEIVEKQYAGKEATFVIDLRTSTLPSAEQQGTTKRLAGRLRLHYKLESYFVVRKWEIVQIENISFAYQKE